MIKIIERKIRGGEGAYCILQSYRDFLSLEHDPLDHICRGDGRGRRERRRGRHEWAGGTGVMMR